MIADFTRQDKVDPPEATQLVRVRPGIHTSWEIEPPMLSLSLLSVTCQLTSQTNLRVNLLWSLYLVSGYCILSVTANKPFTSLEVLIDRTAPHPACLQKSYVCLCWRVSDSA